MARLFNIPVTCNATVTVAFPDPKPLLELGDEAPPLSDADAQMLAERFALSRIMVTANNPDAPDEAAYDDYLNECSEAAKVNADLDWESAHIVQMGGAFTLTNDRYAKVAWTVDDITDQYDITDEQAEEFLFNNARQIADDMVNRGWESIHTLASMADLKKREE